jgi:hypothetical protein
LYATPGITLPCVVVAVDAYAARGGGGGAVGPAGTRSAVRAIVARPCAAIGRGAGRGVGPGTARAGAGASVGASVGAFSLASASFAPIASISAWNFMNSSIIASAIAFERAIERDGRRRVRRGGARECIYRNRRRYGTEPIDRTNERTIDRSSA